MYRKERMASVMRDLLAQEIEKTVDPHGALLTIMDVVVDEDLEKAVVTVSVFPDDKKSGLVRTLNKNASTLAFFLLKKMKIRKVPLLEFV